MDEFLTLIILKYGKPTVSMEYMESLPEEVIFRAYEIIYPDTKFRVSFITMILKLNGYSIFNSHDNGTDRVINALSKALIEYEQK